MKRVACFIDGFNLYHAIDHKYPARYKWCNYRKLIDNFLDPDDLLVKILYFSAYATWDIGKVARHSVFVKALQSEGIEAVMGKFKKKRLRCKKCLQHYKTHEEKESDVNIAIRLTAMAYEDAFDKALLVSGDSDFVSTLTLIREKFPDKRIGVIVPGDPSFANELRSKAHFSKAITETHILNSRFPDQITAENGSIITCPPEYTIPSIIL